MISLSEVTIVQYQNSADSSNAKPVILSGVVAVCLE